MLGLAALALAACGAPTDGAWTFTIEVTGGFDTTGRFELSGEQGRGTFQAHQDQERELDVRIDLAERNVAMRLAAKGLDGELMVTGQLNEAEDRIDGVARDSGGDANAFTARRVPEDTEPVRPLGPGS